MTLQLLSAELLVSKHSGYSDILAAPDAFLAPCTDAAVFKYDTLDERNIHGVHQNGAHGSHQPPKLKSAFVSSIFHAIRHTWHPRTALTVTSAPTGSLWAVHEWKDVWNTIVPVGQGPQPAARLGLALGEVQKSSNRRIRPATLRVWTQLCSTLYASWIFSRRSVINSLPNKQGCCQGGTCQKMLDF